MKSSVYRADRVPSAVAKAARSKSGAGKHGGSDRDRNRRGRRAMRAALRRGDW